MKGRNHRSSWVFQTAIAVCAGLLASVPSIVFADPNPSTSAASLPSFGEVVLRAGLALAAVLAVIAALAFLVKRLRLHAPMSSSKSAVRSLAKLDLGGRREVRVVSVSGRVLVLGVGSDQINLLTEWDDEVEASADTERTQESVPEIKMLQKLASSS